MADEEKTKRIRDLLAEIGDSLPSIIDVASGLSGEFLPDVQRGLALIQKQITELTTLAG